jgi:thioredoxin reductase (NADPH)
MGATDVMSESITKDIAIIGAGPVGLFAIFEAGMLGLDVVVIDALEHLGGQCIALYPEKPIYDIPAYPTILAQDLVERLIEQASPFGPAYLLNRQVTGLSRRPDGAWDLVTSTGDQIVAKTVILAAGAGAFGPNRPPLPDLEAFEAAGSVAYLVRRREDLRGKRIVIGGGGDSAVDWAISLAEVAQSVALVHRRPVFRAAPESLKRLEALAQSGAIELIVPYQLKGLKGTEGRLSAVEVQANDGSLRELEADILLPFYGLSMNLGPIADWGLDLAHKHVSVDPTTCATNLPGFFAIGDIATYPNKLKLILSGFSEAAFAVHAARKVLRPGEEVHFEYSTSRGVPGA